MTSDLDLVVDLSPDNVESLLQAMEETGLKPSAAAVPAGRDLYVEPEVDDVPVLHGVVLAF